MKTLFLISALLLSMPQQSKVYICSSPAAKKYHLSRSCPGLQQCTHNIQDVSVEQAQKDGHTPCLKEK